MRTILIDSETMEPLTVLNLPVEAWNMFDRGAVWRVPAPPEMQATAVVNREPIALEVIELRGIELRNKRGVLYWMAETASAEAALLLRSVFLPGQMSEVVDRERVAMARGALSAYQDMGVL